MPFYLTSLYAVILGLGFLVLTYAVILDRARTHVSIGHGDDMQLATRIRRHGNFTEAVPLALILMMLAESAGASPLWLHLAGATLVVARALHAGGLYHDRAATFGRIAGILGTTVSMLICMAVLVRAALMA
ncbi:MAG: MAPEG family protein [Marinibacterium sp.]